MLARFGNIFVQHCLHAVSAELAAVHVRKEGRCALLSGLLEPVTKGLLCNLCERRTPLFAALADASHMRALTEHYRVSVQVDNLGEPPN